MLLLLYVDDIALSGRHLQNINHVEALLEERFEVADLGKHPIFSDLGLSVMKTQGPSNSRRKRTQERCSGVMEWLTRNQPLHRRM